MKKTILTILAASLIAASSAQTAVAAERHHVRKVVHAPAATHRFRYASDAVVWPETPSSVAYTEGHVISAPAGH